MPSDLNAVSPFELDSPSPRKPHGIISMTIEIPSSSRAARSPETRPPARWKTPEFAFYELAFLIVVPIMIWIPISLSSESHPNYPLFSHRLSSGWLFGRRVDNSDTQYRSFRNNIPALSLLVSAFFIAKSIYGRFSSQRSSPSLSQHTSTIDTALHRIPFLLTFSIVMLLALHGTSIIKVLIILSINYAIAKSFGQSHPKLAPLLTWVVNMGVLFANEWNSGYKFASLHTSLEVLDSISGVYPRWHVSFNITMLRLISFNMDYFWACIREKPTESGSELDFKQRTSTPHPLEIYSYKNYIAYVLYPPLYIAGPIITFNDFIWQIRRPTSISRSTVTSYLMRFLFCLLTMEFILHFMYVVAIKDTKAWVGDTPAELSMVGLWNLMIVWLKLLLPWRFFRLWALADGIDPPENMIRCMANNYSTFGFWRSWHRSYNLWIVRYIYIPLGGTKNVAFTTILVFSFVALWHDLSFRLLAWGWLVSLFVLPELVASYLLPSSKYGGEWWYRHICAFGAIFNGLMMLTANLVGFVVGLDGMSYMITQLLQTWEGLRFFGAACICIFIAVQVMFEYREEEMRQGIYRRC
ncbi:hypothetical protein JAAARDRAFT_33744 [Jaapia argillacea MUCL 33604]|uniref:Glycerol transporter n=1 Tax=Jaapia argillacea MUCL 33604 TaxID=933084 RepID=A0A067Q8V0_9AGAM|nr:hypothetical protein JAAARDRAFT_33744 [Jaapia argillacea MUCL 33604]